MKSRKDKILESIRLMYNVEKEISSISSYGEFVDYMDDNCLWKYIDCMLIDSDARHENNISIGINYMGIFRRAKMKLDKDSSTRLMELIRYKKINKLVGRISSDGVCRYMNRVDFSDNMEEYIAFFYATRTPIYVICVWVLCFVITLSNLFYCVYRTII